MLSQCLSATEWVVCLIESEVVLATPGPVRIMPRTINQMRSNVLRSRLCMCSGLWEWECVCHERDGSGKGGVVGVKIG